MSYESVNLKAPSSEDVKSSMTIREIVMDLELHVT